MPNSYAKESEYTCFSCEEKTTVQTWLIIDVTENPDLLERVKDETIQDLICPNCGESISPDLPLLLYFPGDDPPFLFASRPHTGPGYPEVVVLGMFEQLVESSGDQELKDQYRDHRAWILKEDLPDRLKDFPQTPLRDFDLSAYPELKQLEMTMPDEYLEMVMTSYFGTPDWNQRVMMVERAPMLMTPAVEPYLERMIAGFAEQGMEAEEQAGQDNLDILIRARDIGYVYAVNEFQEQQ